MDWRPIETAPKDGTRVLVFRQASLDHEVGIARFEGGDWCDDDDFVYYGVTHWMPLPEPPKK